MAESAARCHIVTHPHALQCAVMHCAALRCAHGDHWSGARTEWRRQLVSLLHHQDPCQRRGWPLSFFFSLFFLSVFVFVHSPIRRSHELRLSCLAAVAD